MKASQQPRGRALRSGKILEDPTVRRSASNNRHDEKEHERDQRDQKPLTELSAPCIKQNPESSELKERVLNSTAFATCIQESTTTKTNVLDERGCGPSMVKNLFRGEISMETLKNVRENGDQGIHNEVSEFPLNHENEGTTKSGEKILGKRANRGYNPKYDQTQFVCSDDYLGSSGKKKNS